MFASCAHQPEVLQLARRADGTECALALLEACIANDTWRDGCRVHDLQCPRKPCDCARRGACRSAHYPVTVNACGTEGEADRVAPLRWLPGSKITWSVPESVPEHKFPR